MARKSRKIVTVPKKSALAAFVFGGVDGGCMMCRQPIVTHLTRTGAWLGCADQRVPPTARMILVVERRHAESPRESSVMTRHAATSQDRSRPESARVKRVVYLAKYATAHKWFASKLAKIVSDRDREVYQTVAGTPRGLTRTALLARFNAWTRTGIVDGALYRLRHAGLLTLVRQEG